MNKSQVQELCESVTIRALNGGALSGFVFSHNDSPKRAKADQISVKAGAPEPQLDGPGGFLVEVEVEIKSKQSPRNAALHGAALERISSREVWRGAALGVMKETDDLYIINEDIGGDRSEGNNVRKRTITIPMRINAH